MSNWYRNWFNSPFYHQLYKNRDFSEAEFFIKKVIQHFDIPRKSIILDLACGKGRHSIFLNQLGMEVTGIDLSEESILAAQKWNSETLRFVQGDMREVYRENHFDYVLNLFTSFGYFKENNENLKVIDAIGKSLKPNGFALIDYFNAIKVKRSLPQEENKIINKTSFAIEKFEDEGMVHKKISFEKNGERHSFQESVKLFNLADFQFFFDKAGLRLEAVFGNYKLNDFDEDADRLLMWVKKR